jgi:hypothetical protein
VTQYLSQGGLTLLLVRAILWGAVLGAGYSVFGIRRVAVEKLRIPRLIGSICLQVEDFLICVAGGAGLCILYFATTQGVLRIMAIPALGLGILAWRLSGGRLVTICTDRILYLLARMVRLIVRYIVSPIGRWGKLFGRWIARRAAEAHRRRYQQRLAAMAKKITPRYQRALCEACLVGALPDPRDRLCRKGKGKRSGGRLSRKQRG